MIKKYLIKALIKTANLLSDREKFVSSKNLRIIPWLRDKGDSTHSINHDLSDSSVVFDLGGYLGDWSKEIFKKYHCQIHIFEPVNKFYQEIKLNLQSDKIKINHFGLAEKTYRINIFLDNEASSLYKRQSDQVESIQLYDFMDYIKEQKISKIDLLKINIEGAEYDLLDYLLKTGYILNIDNIQVQFHDFFPSSETRMMKIQSELTKTHRLTFQYPFIWENWQIIKQTF
jgi:FkbM family methyltransferase